MKKISLKGISEILSEKDLKNIRGGSNTGNCNTCNVDGTCVCNGRTGTCKYSPFAGGICWIG